MLSTLAKILLLVFFCAQVLGIEFTKKTNIPLTGFSPDLLQYSPDQAFLVALDTDGHAFKIYDGHSLAELQSVKLDVTVDPISAQFSHNSNYLAMGDKQGSLYVYGRSGKAFTSTPIDTQIIANNSGVLSIAYSNDDKKLVAGDFDGVINIFDAPTNDQQIMMQQYGYLSASLQVDFGGKVQSVVFTPNGNLLAGGGDNQVGGLMKLFDAANNWNVIKSFNPSQIVLGLAASSDGSFFLSTGQPPATGGSAQITVWNAQTYTINSTLPLTQSVGAFYQVLISDNNLYIAAAGNVKAFTWQRTSTTTAFTQNTVIDSGIDNIALSPKGGMLLVTPPGNSQIDQYSLCGTKTFYQSNSNNCNACLPQCNDCYGNNPNQCLQCAAGFYNDNNLCKACIAGCTDCIDGISCNTCGSKYFKDGTICTKCVNGCLSCADAGSCNTCDLPNNWKPVGNVCDCISGFFQQNEKCVACVLGCLSCTNTATCQTCDISKGFVPQNNICVCPQRTRLNVNTCQACGLGCLACTPTQCNTCDAKQHFVPLDPVEADCECDDKGNWVEGPAKVCICRDRYFENKNEACELCRAECTLCIGRNNCTTCDTSFTGIDPIADDGRCLCLDRTQFVDVNNKVCVSCSDSVIYCTRCDGPNQCTLCDETLNRVLDNGVCVCSDNHFLNTTTNLCDPCGIDGCLKCADTTNCTLCDQKNYWIDGPDGTCLCLSRHINIKGVCQFCEIGCIQCSPSPDFCVECDQDRNFNDTNLDYKCECIDGTYYDGDITCLDCQFGCQSCADKNDCSVCYDDFQLKDGDCFCETGKYKLNRTDCADCVLTGCEDCVSAAVCTTCLPDYKLNIIGQCDCKDDKTYPDGTKCTACVQPCLACKNKDTCISCIQGYTFQDGVCKEDGISVLLIVIIVVGVLALAGAGFAVVKYCRKKKSPLEEEGEYEPVE